MENKAPVNICKINVENGKHFTEIDIFSQIDKKMEELKELKQAIKNNDLENIIEETVDNMVLDSQFKKGIYDLIFLKATGKSMYNFTDDMVEIYCEKVLRTKKRIEENYY